MPVGLVSETWHNHANIPYIRQLEHHVKFLEEIITNQNKMIDRLLNQINTPLEIQTPPENFVPFRSIMTPRRALRELEKRHHDKAVQNNIVPPIEDLVGEVPDTREIR